jgi:hypothetical protein
MEDFGRLAAAFLGFTLGCWVGMLLLQAAMRAKAAKNGIAYIPLFGRGYALMSEGRWQHELYVRYEQGKQDAWNKWDEIRTSTVHDCRVMSSIFDETRVSDLEWRRGYLRDLGDTIDQQLTEHPGTNIFVRLFARKNTPHHYTRDIPLRDFDAKG